MGLDICPHTFPNFSQFLYSLLAFPAFMGLGHFGQADRPTYLVATAFGELLWWWWWTGHSFCWVCSGRFCWTFHWCLLCWLAFFSSWLDDCMHTLPIPHCCNFPPGHWVCHFGYTPPGTSPHTPLPFPTYLPPPCHLFPTYHISLLSPPMVIFAAFWLSSICPF